MLGTAVYLAQDILVFWQYHNKQGWMRYPAAEKEPGNRTAFLIQCLHSAKYKMFHCEPIVNWPIEKLVLVFCTV